MKPMTTRIVGTLVVVVLLAAGPARSAEKIKITVPAHTPTFAPLYHAGNRFHVYARQRNDTHLRAIFATQSDNPYFSVPFEAAAGSRTRACKTSGSRAGLEVFSWA